MQTQSSYDSVLDLLFQLNYLPDINCQRIFAHLLVTSAILNAKQISQALDLPDSKVYPALNKLIDIGLVVKNKNKRPSTYYLNNLHKIEDFFHEKLEEQIHKQQAVVDGLISESYKLWNPKEIELDNIAYLFHDREIATEIIRMIKHAKSSLMLLLSPNSETYLSLILEKLKTILQNEIHVLLSIPSQMIIDNKFQDILSSPNFNIKVSVYTGNSYLIADEKLMLNITHRPEADVGLLTNDTLLVKNILECWEDETCCVLPSSDNIQLEVLSSSN